MNKEFEPGTAYEVGEHLGAGDSSLDPRDIQPEDCTLALMAVAKNLGDEDAIDTLLDRETVKNGLPALGCIACRAKISLDGGYANEPKGLGVCSASFAEEAREIVAPETHARNKSIVEQAIKANK